MAGAPPSSNTGPLSSSSSGSLLPPASAAIHAGAAPKILLAKPPGIGAAASKFGREDEPSSAAAALRARVPLSFLTENTDFTVVGIIGPPGAGKSTIMNELYGYDGASAGMLPPFSVQSDETRSMARHCTMGIEIRISSERLILLDAQPIFSPSVLSDMTRPDGTSSIPVLNGEPLSVDLAHELMGIQLAVFLASVCHVLLVVTEGIHDVSMWQLMLMVDMLKHNIPDPSLMASSHAQAIKMGTGKEWRDEILAPGEEFLATPFFVHTKLRHQDLSPRNVVLLKKMLGEYFRSSSFCTTSAAAGVDGSGVHQQELSEQKKLMGPDLVLLPLKAQDSGPQHESFTSTLGKLRDQVLSMNPHSFTKPISERDWLRNSAKVWEMVKRSPVIADYCSCLQNSGQFRK
ncbi:unnamed protein product [Spirodela intermedia]|uniref:Uncharacterized protein n=1 Tax=Spirodela intermedia TaxID=51605 RepID=A0A7I8JA53_SPIIN|nr:unnamed protein product [Spirodela intermedia]CAA6667027.1 unnamed protein product [Spirodela intermedia]